MFSFTPECPFLNREQVKALERKGLPQAWVITQDENEGVSAPVIILQHSDLPKADKPKPRRSHIHFYLLECIKL